MTYGTKWARSRRRLLREITEAEARARHESGDTYAVLIEGGPEGPLAAELTLEVGAVNVFFLDEEHRDAAEYAFADAGLGQPLRLSTVYLRQIVDRRTIVAQESFHFAADGTVHRAVRGPGIQGEEVTVAHIDPAEHPELREPPPAFGDYASITRWERHLPLSRHGVVS